MSDTKDPDALKAETLRLAEEALWELLHAYPEAVALALDLFNREFTPGNEDRIRAAFAIVAAGTLALEVEHVRAPR